MSHVEVTLRNTTGVKPPFTYQIDPVDHPLAERWMNALDDAVKQGMTPDPDFCFMGFPRGPRNIALLCRELSSHIATINHAFMHGGPNDLPPYQIDASEFVPANIKGHDGRMNREAMNSLHRHFEHLQGESDIPTAYYLQSSPKVQDAICRLNWLCHEIECRVIGERNLAFGRLEAITHAQITTFHASPTYGISGDDYRLHTLDREPGDVFMHYAVVGKTAFAAFCDDDLRPDEGAERLSPHVYGSASFDVEWGQWASASNGMHKARKRGFTKVSEKIGIDPAQGHGYLKIGRIDLAKHFPNKKVMEVQEFLSDYLHIEQISVIR